jgi:hypothetical protein
MPTSKFQSSEGCQVAFYIKRHRKKFRHHGDLEPGTCASVSQKWHWHTKYSWQLYILVNSLNILRASKRLGTAVLNLNPSARVFVHCTPQWSPFFLPMPANRSHHTNYSHSCIQVGQHAEPLFPSSFFFLYLNITAHYFLSSNSCHI